MKIIIAGESYAMDEAITGAKLRDVKYLIRASRTKDTPPVTPKTIQELFQNLAQQAENPDFDQVAWLLDDTVLNNLQGVMWLAKRHAGEDIAFDEISVALNGFSFSDDEDVPDPKDEAADLL